MNEINTSFSNALRIKERISYLTDTKELNSYSDWMERKSLVNPKERIRILSLSNMSESDMNKGTKILDSEEKKLLFNKVVKHADWYILYRHIMNNYEITRVETIEKIISPMVNYANAHIEGLIKKSSKLEFATTVKHDLLKDIINELLKFFVKPIIVDFNKHKSINKCGYEYSDYFNHELDTKEQLNKFYSEYPVSLRLAITKLQFITQNISDLFVRLSNDISKINKIFKIQSKKIINLSCSQGDSHERGKTVIIVTFENNEKIVYKPKKLDILNIYQEFISWINDNSGLKKLSTVRSLKGVGYHYEEYIENNAVKSIDEVKDYYEKFGYYVAVFHILCGNDLHLENIIATDKGPIPIDLETIFQNSIPLNIPHMAGIEAKYDLSVESVIGTSLLPVIGFTDNKEGKGIDISALNGKEAKLPFKVLVPKDVNTSNFRYEYDYITRQGSKNELFFDGQRIEFHDYSQLIINGFFKMIRFFENNKDSLIKQLSKFKNCTVRNVIKPTSKYMSLLEFSYHPKYLKNMIDREHLLENNWAYPYRKKEVVPSEIEDMVFDDVPIFYSKIDDVNLIDSSGKMINDYFEFSGLEKAIRRVEKLNNYYIEKQKDIMTVSLGLYDEKLEKLKGQYEIKNLNNDLKGPIKKEEILEYIESLAFEIYKDSYKSKNGGITWANINQVIDRWEVEPMEVGLYRGLSGVALFYLELYNFTKKTLYIEIYQGILKSIFSEYKNYSEISAFTGGVSIGFLLLREEEILGTVHIEKYNEIITYINENLDLIQNDDWISGKAGILSLLSEIYLKHPDKHIYSIAKKIIESLISDNTIDQVGFGHGNSGIALSLLKAHEVFGVEAKKLKNKIINLLEYENSIIKKINKYTWCNGTTGIGLARLEMNKMCKDINIKEIICKPLLISYENISSIFKNDDCLCHGNMGDIEFLHRYCNYTNDIHARKTLNTKLNYFLKNKKINTRGLNIIHENNLFLGKCGIAYELLNLITPFDISSPLLYKI
ncbi:TPA: type 2 lanthipeptide synthetase LanM [Staphylococcus aureus]